MAAFAAHFEDPSETPAPVPVEDKQDADVRHDKVSHLRMSQYGTGDAAMNWQKEVARVMVKHGFRRGR